MSAAPAPAPVPRRRGRPKGSRNKQQDPVMEEAVMEYAKGGTTYEEMSEKHFGDKSRADAIAYHYKRRPELHPLARMPEKQVCTDPWHLAKYRGKRKAASGRIKGCKHDYHVWPRVGPQRCPKCKNIAQEDSPRSDPFWKAQCKTRTVSVSSKRCSPLSTLERHPVNKNWAEDRLVEHLTAMALLAKIWRAVRNEERQETYATGRTVEVDRARVQLFTSTVAETDKLALSTRQTRGIKFGWTIYEGV